MGRHERRERWESLFSPGLLALVGALVSLAVLFQPSLAAKILLMGLAATAAWLSGRRLSPLTTLLVMAGIVGANLLVPLGKRLAEWGPILITQTALFDGIEKAATFEALMFVSKATLSPALRFPGRFGAFFSEALRSYDRILEHRGGIKAATFIKDIDAVLVSVYYEIGGPSASPDWNEGRKWKPGDRYLPLAVIAAALTFTLGWR